MKTAQILRRFAFDEWGGTETVVWNTSRALCRQGIGAEILATSALARPGSELCEGIAIQRFPYCYPYFPMGRERRLTLDKKGGNPVVPQLAGALRRGGYDLLHLHTGGRMGQMAAQAARRLGIPYVMSFHGGCYDVPQAELEEMLRPLRGTLRYGGILDRLFGWRRDLMAGAAGLLCVGANELQPLRERYPDKNILFLPNGVDPDKFSGAVPDIRQSWNIPAARRLWLCVSRIDYQKDQKFLVRSLRPAMASGEDVHLLLIGPVSAPQYAAELRELIRSEGVEDRVTLIPGLEAEDPLLRGAFRAADVFVLASQHEPFGIVVLEAWSAGLPVVTSKVGGLGHLVGDGVNGLQFAPGDQEAFLAAVTRLREEAGLGERLGAEGRQTVLREYTWDIISGRLVRFYEEILGKKAVR